MPRLATLEVTVHQIIITYDTSKYDNLRRNSIERIDAYEEENDDQQIKQEHKLEVNILWIPVTYISMKPDKLLRLSNQLIIHIHPNIKNIVKSIVPYMQYHATFLSKISAQNQ